MKEPGGIVTSIPGLKRRNRRAGTTRSAFVSVIPRMRAMAQYIPTNMRAFIKTSCTEVFMVVKTPGLSTTKSARGTAIFSIIYIYV
jgi:hypothetical protein